MDPASYLNKNFHAKSVIVAEYVWIDGNNSLRSKARTLPVVEGIIYDSPSKIPEWSYDGSSTNQTCTEDSDVILRPVAIFFDPFRGYPNLLVLCETFTSEGKYLETNNRAWARDIFDITVSDTEPWYGMEQEFFLMTPQNRPIGFPQEGSPSPQGKYYCGVGPNNIFGREILDEFYNSCIYAAIKISGINAEVANSQWEFQIGPCTGIEVGDHLWIARYVLQRIAEKYGVVVNYHPKPLSDPNWNGSGLHTNFSTRAMREEGGIRVIKEALKKLESTHKHHMHYYGTDNDKRMTGRCETASYDKFNWGVRHRGASVRIPPHVAINGKGYFEDRRPASNADPYTVSALIYQTVCHDLYTE